MATDIHRIIEISFDGGCKPTNPGEKYGSFQIKHGLVEIFKATRISFGWGTNNEAEYDALIRALLWVEEEMGKAGLPLNLFTLKVLTDSTIVRNRIATRNMRGKSEPAARMANLARQCLSIMDCFGGWTIEWERRTENVKRFGH